MVETRRSKRRNPNSGAKEAKVMENLKKDENPKKVYAKKKKKMKIGPKEVEDSHAAETVVPTAVEGSSSVPEMVVETSTSKVKVYANKKKNPGEEKRAAKMKIGPKEVEDSHAAETVVIVAQAQLKSQLLARTSLQQNHKGLVLNPLVAICFPGRDVPSWFCHQRMGSSIETDLLPHWCNSKCIGASLCVVVTFKDYEGQYANRLSVRCKCNFKNQNGQSISFSFCLGGWNESCGSSCHEPRKLGSDHVFISYNNCNVPVFQWSEESNDGNRCRPTNASFEFYLTDNTERKLEGCNVIRCGMSLLYAPDENDCGFQGTRVADIVERTPSEAFVPVRGQSYSQVGERRNGRIRDEIPL